MPACRRCGASELEWQALERAVGLPEVEIEQRNNRGTIEGARLKPGGDTGFDVQYGGWRRHGDGSYSSLDENVAYWTSTEVDLAHAQHRDIDSGDDMIWRSPVVKHYALSVRCIVDRYGEDEADLAWSPDGMRIAFKSYRDGNDEIYVMAADGSQQVNLTRNPASDGGPSFKPDGKHLFFASNRDGNRELYRRTEILFEGNDSGNASWRRSDGAVVFGAAVQNEQGEPGRGCIQIALPGGAGMQPLTGRLAGTFGE